MTPVLVLAMEEDPLARKVAGAANMSKDQKKPDTLFIG